MADELVSALWKEADLRVLVVLTSEVSRHARGLHRAAPTSAALLAQGLTAAALMGALQKESSRINLQLECDGPVRGLFADSNGQGVVRGYVKNAQVDLPLSTGVFRWRPVLGNSGFLSVLRDLGGEFYRSAVQLQHFDLSLDLGHYFRASEQLETIIQLELLPAAAEPLGTVAGLLLQPLPNGSREELAKLAAHLVGEGGFRRALEAAPGASAASLLTSLVPRVELEVMSRYPVFFQCGCSVERVKNALLALGRDGLEDLLAKEGKAEVTCEFCMTQYVLTESDIRALLKAGSD